MFDNKKISGGFSAGFNPSERYTPATRTPREPQKLPVNSQSLSQEVISAAYDGYAAAKDMMNSSVQYAKQTAASYIPNFVDQSEMMAHPAYQLLSADSRRQLHRLPAHLARQAVMDVDSNTTPMAMKMQLAHNLKNAMKSMVEPAQIDFKSGAGAQWSVENLLDLSNAINNLPLAHKKQLDGVTFSREQKADMSFVGPSMPGMLDDMAAEMIAGHYDINDRTVILYDRGIKDQLPEFGQTLKTSLRSIQQVRAGGYSEDLKSLQEMLNPYLEASDKSAITPDGRWGENTEQAVRTVQAKLMTKYLEQKYNLTSEQQRELKGIEDMASSPQFEMISRYVNIKDKLEGLNLLPDTHMKQLIDELSNGEFGETSLKFLLNDVSNAFRTNPHVSRTEELMTHEMGHHFQLGLKNESHYISEFAKLSGWIENSTGRLADGFKASSYTPETMQDVFNQLASDNKVDEGVYSHQVSLSNFVTEYAATDPMEDFAESYKTFVLNPGALLKSSPSKFFFINSMPTIQSRKMGAGAKERAHYSADQITYMATDMLQKQYGRNYTPLHLKSFLQDNFNNLLGQGPQPPPFHLSPDTLLSIVDTHRDLLDKVDMSYISKADIQKQTNDQDLMVLRMMYDHSVNLMEKGADTAESEAFFDEYLSPKNINENFPHLSEKMRTNIQDPAFASMMKAMAKIGAHALNVNQVKQVDLKDEKEYTQAKDYFSLVMKQPSALLSTQVFTQSYEYLSGLGSKYIYNPEDHKIQKSLKFMEQLKSDPSQVFDEWDSFPDQFKDMLKNERFVNAVSGNLTTGIKESASWIYNRKVDDNYTYFLPSADAVKGSLEKVMSVIEFQRGIDKFRRRGTGGGS